MSVSKEQEKYKNIKPHYAFIAGGAALITAAILILAKLGAYWHGGSVSVLASLVDSVVDISVSLMNFWAIRYSLQPADHEHRHGHGKIEGLAAVFQGAFIFGSGVFLAFESVSRFITAQTVIHHWTAIAVMVFSIVLSAGLIFIQKHSLKFAPSLTVEAEKNHYATDIVINTGVIATLAILFYGGPKWLDPVFALIIAAYLAWTARNIAMKGVDMLLDKELSEDMREYIAKKIRNHDGVLGMHDLRTHKSGMRIFISFDIEVDSALSLYCAHEIAKEVEQKLLNDFPDAEIMIHVDPEGQTEDSRHRVAGIHD